MLSYCRTKLGLVLPTETTRKLCPVRTSSIGRLYFCYATIMNQFDWWSCVFAARKLDHPDRIRVKDRVSFTDGCARYDFTVVQSQDLRSGKDVRMRTSYEIEIEFLPPPPTNNPRGNLKHLDYVMTHMIFCMRHMLLTLQGSPEIISLSKRHNILLEYNTLTRVRHFLGAQPETLHRHHLSRIRSGYSVSEKYDGERSLFFVSDDGNSYLIDRTMQVRLAQQAPSQKERGTILDVEVCGANVFAFDIVFHKGRDLRDRQDMDLLSRLDVLSSTVATLNDEHRMATGIRHQQQHLHVKKHYLSNDFAIVFDRWKQEIYKDSIPRDGFIFTPLAEPYPSKTKWGTLLKWKPAEMNSIDFLLADPVESPLAKPKPTLVLSHWIQALSAFTPGTHRLRDPVALQHATSNVSSGCAYN